MKFNKFAIIFVASGADPKRDRAVIKTDAFTYTTVGISAENKGLVIEVAKELAKDGAQIIELCGGFGPIWMGKVIEALKGSVRFYYRIE